MRYGEEEAIGPGSQAEPIWKEERGHGVVLRNADFEVSRNSAFHQL